MGKNAQDALLQRIPVDLFTNLKLKDPKSAESTFIVKSLLGAGGSSLVYNVEKRSGKDGNINGTLKEFYPMAFGDSKTCYTFSEYLKAQDAFRRADGVLVLPPEICRAQTQRLRQVVRELRELKENGDLRFVIPHMELYLNEAGVPYLFTPENFAGVTMETYCEGAYREPTEAALSQILHTLYAAACADSQLCRRGLLLLDIKPANLLIPYNSNKTALLQDAVSLFDVESVVPVQQLKNGCREMVLPFSPGFTAPELGGFVEAPRVHAVGAASDVFALAATLYTALTGQPVQLETADGYAEALQAGPFGRCMGNGLAEELGALLEKALAYEPRERTAAPEAFAEALAQVIRIWEERSSARKVRRWEDLQNRLPDMLTDLLFRWPVFTYSAAPDEKDMRVLVAGNDEKAIRQALQALFSVCHVLHYQLHVRVVCRNAQQLTRSWYEGIDSAEQWIQYRSYPGETAPYPWEKYIGELSWVNAAPTPVELPLLADDFRAGTVLILAGSEAENDVLAKSVTAPEAGRRLCSYLSITHGRPLFADSEAALERVPLTPLPADDLIGQQAEHIAFNAHLVYARSKNPNTSLQQLHAEFRNGYNRTASLKAALAIRARLWSVGLGWHEDAERDGTAFAQAVAETPGLVAQLSWLEHRRWAADKLCSGARLLPETLYHKLQNGGTNGSGTNIKLEVDGQKVLHHAYLVPSSLEETRPAGWQTPREWQQHTGSEPIPEELDPLSRAGAGLARMFAGMAARIAPALRSESYLPLQMVQFAVRETAQSLPETAAAELTAAYRQLEQSIRALTVDHPRPSAAALYRLEYSHCKQLLQTTGADESLAQALDNLNDRLFCFCYIADAVEVKALDTVLIENVPFQLRGRPMTVAKLMSSDLMDNLLVSKAFLTEKLLCVAYCSSGRAAAAYAQDAENLAAALEMDGADCAVELRLILKDGVSAPPPGTVPLQAFPAGGALAEALAQALQGAEMIDLTGGQQKLCALAGGFKNAEVCPLVERQSDNRYTAVRGRLPAALPTRQPCRVNEMFRLSGAVPCSAEGDVSRADYTRLYALYEEILATYGKQLFYDTCEVFSTAYEKASRVYVVPPVGPLNTALDYRLDLQDCEKLLPLLRELAANGFIANLAEEPEDHLLHVRFLCADNNASYLHKLLQNHLNHSRPVTGYARNDWGDLRYVVTLSPGSVGVAADKPGCRQVLEYLAQKGCLRLQDTPGPYGLQVSAMKPFVPIMLEKYGTSLEKGLYVQLRSQPDKFEDVQTNYEYVYQNTTRNELDLVLSCRDQLVLVSCKACRELSIGFVDEILARAQLLRCHALPVLACSELMPGQNTAFRERCRACGVLLLDGLALPQAADRICAEVSARSVEL